MALVNCTKCAYCMPCPFGPNIPELFAAYNMTASHGMTPAKEAYEALSVKADACRACHHCEKECPQHIKISEMMPKSSPGIRIGGLDVPAGSGKRRKINMEMEVLLCRKRKRRAGKKGDKARLAAAAARLGVLQRRLKDEKIPVIITFDGFDAAGKGLQISRLIQALDPRGFDVYTGDRDGEEGGHAPVFMAVCHPLPGKGPDRHF